MRNTLTSLIESIPSTGEWGPIAIRLLEIKKGHQLASLGMSFSSFITELAHKRGKTESTYWRLAKAGEVYSKIRNALDPKGMELPELTDPAVLATPESLAI